MRSPCPSSRAQPSRARNVAAALTSTGGTLGGGLAAVLAALKKKQPPVFTSPPPGTYDPAIDAQVGQAGRGLGDLLSDYVRDYGEPGTALGGRAGEDYATGKAAVQRNLDSGLQDVNTGADRSLADLQRTSGRTLADLLRDRARAGENYGSSIEGLQRNYAQLGSAQTQTARAAGVQRGGALAQALAKRQANQAIDRQPIDTGFARFGQDSTQAQGRLGEDTQLGTSRIGEDRTLATGRLQAGAATDFASLGRGLLRGTEDAATQLARAGRENTQFGLDANAARFYQANVPLPGPAAAKSATPKKKKTTVTAGRFQ